jgi:UTP-glucose-1-phosphate uridylyltransferase
MCVTRAVIAAGGVGSKMLPMTTVLAKEMLPIRDKPILEHLVTELRDAGIEQVLFVISARKTIIVEYFGSGSAWNMEFSYRVQDPGDGPGAPVLLAEHWVGERPFVYAFGDNLITTPPGEMSALRRLLAEHTAHPHSWALLAEIRRAHGLPRNETVLGPTDHPPHHQRPFSYRCGAPAENAVVCAARWVLTPSVFAAQRACPRRASGERYLVDAVQNAVRAGHPLHVVPLTQGERRYNMDIWPTYHACAADLARPELDLMAGTG